MKTNELRIGSTYMSTKFGVPVTLTAEDIVQMVSNADGAEIYPDSVVLPIPITEEWLIKFGAERINAHDNKYWLVITMFDEADEWNKPFIHYRPENDYAELLDIEYEERICVIETVHQLQNIFFALTGEELTAK